MSNKQSSGSHQIEDKTGNPSYPIALIDAHNLETIDNQAKLTQQDWRTVAHVLVKRAIKYSRSFSKVDSAEIHHIIQSAGIAYDKAYKGSVDTGKGPQQVLIQLFGASGVGESIARNLTAMIPIQHIDDADVVDAEGQDDVVVTPAPPSS